MITLKEISQLTGVSVSTVSRVLSGKGRISEKTRKHVMGAVQELLFKPGLITGSSQVSIHDVGVITPDHGEFFHDDPSTSFDLRSLKSEIENTGNKPHVIELRQFHGKQPGDLRTEKGAGFDGFVVFDPPADWSFLEPLTASGLPYIVTNGRQRDHMHNYVDTDNHWIGRTQLDYLADLGHRSICVLTGPMDRMTSRNRLDGVQDACRERGVMLDPSLIVSGEFSLDSGYERMTRLLGGRVPFTAIIAFSDFIALGAMKACKENGLRIPDDVSIIGIDDIEFSSYSDPPLTTFDRQSASVAAIVARDVQQLILYGDVVQSINVNLTAKLIERDSCGSPPQKSTRARQSRSASDRDVAVQAEASAE